MHKTWRNFGNAQNLVTKRFKCRHGKAVGSFQGHRLTLGAGEAVDEEVDEEAESCRSSPSSSSSVLALLRNPGTCAQVKRMAL